MRRALLSAFLACFACSEAALIEGRSEQPIIGGQPSPPGDYLETGAILSVYDFGGGQSFGSFTCTGTLIAPDVVMMAAHCAIDLFGGSIPSWNYFTFQLDVSDFGVNNLDLPPDAVEFAELVPHPLFDLNSFPPPGLGNFNDVGLGFLKEPFAGVVPGVVADAQDAALLTVGLSVEIVGYGQTNASSMEAGIKHQAISFINEINQHEMQIGDVPPTDPQKCHGDSGGPTFVQIDDGREPQRRVIGITSRAYDDSDCNKGGVDMRADAFRDWFDQMMRDRCTSGLRPASVCAGGGGLPLPGGEIPPPIDAGFPDTGVPIDTGVVIQPDAGEPEEDAGTIAMDAEPGPSMDASAPPTGGRPRRPRNRGCGCSSTEYNGASPASLLAFALLVFALRSRVRPR